MEHKYGLRLQQKLEYILLPIALNDEGDYAIPGCPDINGEGSLTPPLIEAVYPASGLPVGTSGTVYCSNAYGTWWYELEVQLV